MSEFKKVTMGMENVKCILRGYYSGVFYGVIEEVKVFEGIQMFKITGRMLYRFKSKKGISLLGLAEYGIEVDSSTKIENPVTFLCYDINQILPCTEECIKTFEEIKLNFNL